MDTLIFLLILWALYSMRKKEPRRTWILLALSFLACALLFWHHVTDVLPISL